MSIHIGKNSIYNPDKVFRIETNNSNVLNLQSKTNQINFNIQNFNISQNSNINKILSILEGNTILTSFNQNEISFYPEVFIQNNMNVTSNVIISSNISITGKINNITDLIDISSDNGNIYTNNVFSSNLNILSDGDIDRDVFLIASNTDSGLHTFALISTSNNGEFYIQGNLGIGTQPNNIHSISVSSNVIVNANTYTSNIYTSSVNNRDISSVSGISLTEDSLYLTADNSVIINKYSLGTELNLDIVNVNNILNTTNLNIDNFININNSTDNPALYIKQGLTEEGYFVNSNNANPISVVSEFTDNPGFLSNIFQLSAKGHITLGGLYPDPENTNSEYMIRGDIRDNRLDYMDGYIHFTNSNIDKQNFTITQDGHIGIGTEIPKGFIEIKNNFTEIENNYNKPNAILQLKTNGTPIPILNVLSSNNTIFEITSNATFNFIQELDDNNNIVASNIYAPNITIDSIQSASNIINFNHNTLSNISHMDMYLLSVSNVNITGELRATGNVNATNISTNVIGTYTEGDYTEIYFISDKLLATADGIAINVPEDHYSTSNSRITGIYLNTSREINDIKGLHILGENTIIRNVVNNQTNIINSKVIQEFNINSNIFQIGIKNTNVQPNASSSIYIASLNDEVTNDTIDINTNNCAFSIGKNNDITIGNNFYVDESSRVSIGYAPNSLENTVNIKGDVKIVNESNEPLFLIENNGNIGFGTDQIDATLSIINKTSNQDYFIVYDTNTNNTEFIIDKNNKIGIGTINNTDARLLIKGDIYPGLNVTHKLTDDNNRWSNIYVNSIDINGISLQNNPIGGLEIEATTKGQLINYTILNTNTNSLEQYYTNSNEMMNTYETTKPKNSINITKADIYDNNIVDRITNKYSLIYSPVNNDWSSITWSSNLSLFAAVSESGTGNRVMTSPDGITWTTQSSAADNNWKSICWALELGLFVAVGSSGTGNRVMTSPDGINWTTRSSAADNNWTSVSWSSELSLLVAVSSSGTNNRVMTSPDGINWTTRTTPTTNWRDICWVPELGLFVTVGDILIEPSIKLTNYTTNTSNGTYIVSASTNYPGTYAYHAFDGDINTVWHSDVITYVNSNYTGSNSLGGYYGEWIKLQLPYSISLQKIRIKPRIAFSTRAPKEGYILGSNNGTDWTLISNFTNLIFTNDDSQYINNLNSTTEYLYYAMVVSKINGVDASANSVQIAEMELYTNINVMTSPDGINWTTKTSAADYNWIDVCWSPELELLVAISNNSNSESNVMVSSDGINWTLYHTPINNKLQSICWSKELSSFIVTGINEEIEPNTNTIITSPDGYNWTVTKELPYINNYTSIIWSPELYRFVAVSNSGNYQLLVSGNPNPIPVNSFGTELQTGGGGLNVIAPVVNKDLTWTTRVSPVDEIWDSICWSPELGIFVAVSWYDINNNIVMISNDGINWSTYLTGTNNKWDSICWSPELGLFVAVAWYGNNNQVMTSPDGINWTTHSTNNNAWVEVCWSPELLLFAAVADSGSGNRVMTSPDGINWTTRSTNDNRWHCICWAAELRLFVALSYTGTGDRVMTSPDGINWTIRSSPVDNEWINICWSAELGLLVAVAQSGIGNRVMTSSDGINWTVRNSPVDNKWKSVCWSAELGLFVAVSESGNNNRVMTSSDGINWTTLTTNNNNFSSVCWSPELSLLVAVSWSGTGNRIMTAEGNKINKTILYTKNDNTFIYGSLGIRTEPPINSGLTIKQSFSPDFSNSSGHNLHISPGIQIEGDIHKWGIFINSTDGNNDLVFAQTNKNTNYTGVCAYISRYPYDTQMNFTGQHRCHIENIHIDIVNQHEGLIVSANNNKYINMVDGVVTGNKSITINESLPVVSITSKENDKSVFGVISSIEDKNKRDIRYGTFVTPYNKEEGDNRVYINSIGEGSIWISNKNGNIYSGEYITSSDIPGYGQKQNDDILHNYTVAKITMDCDFNPLLQPIRQIKTYLSSSNVNEPVTDEYGNIVFENTNEYEYSYKLRYLLEDGTIISEEDYNTLLSYGSNVYKAAFVGCTYHCG